MIKLKCEILEKSRPGMAIMNEREIGRERVGPQFAKQEILKKYLSLIKKRKKMNVE
jgi:hypothetical protein